MKGLHSLLKVVDFVMPTLFLVSWAQHVQMLFGVDITSDSSFNDKYIKPFKDSSLLYKLPYVGVLAFWLLVYSVNKKKSSGV